MTPKECMKEWDLKLDAALLKLAEYMGWRFDYRVYLFEKWMPTGDKLSWECDLLPVNKDGKKLKPQEADDVLMAALLRSTVATVHSLLKEKEETYWRTIQDET